MNFSLRCSQFDRFQGLVQDQTEPRRGYWNRLAANHARAIGRAAADELSHDTD